MTKTAFINGKILDLSNHSQKILNLVIGNQKIIGQGYVPDDEDATIIDINNTYILPNVCVFPYEDLEIVNSKSLQTPDVLEALFKKSTPFITTTSGSELMYLLQQSQPFKTPLHCVLQNADTDLIVYKQAKATNPNLTASIPINLLRTNKALQNAIESLYEENLIQGIMFEKKDESDCLNFCFNDLLSIISIETSIKLLTTLSYTLLKKKEGLSLMATPNFHVRCWPI